MKAKRKKTSKFGLVFGAGSFLAALVGVSSFLPAVSGCEGPFAACLRAAVLNMPENALKQQFPGARVKRKSIFLGRAGKKALEKQLGFSLKSRLHAFYIARRGGKLIGYGIFDTHRVRTKNETLFIVFDESGVVRHVEVIAFHEPDEFMAPRRWFKLFRGKRSGFQPGADIPVISGATLTVNAATRSVRKAALLRDMYFGARTR